MPTLHAAIASKPSTCVVVTSATVTVAAAPMESVYKSVHLILFLSFWLVIDHGGEEGSSARFLKSEGDISTDFVKNEGKL